MKKIKLLLLLTICAFVSKAQPILIGKTTYDNQSNASSPNRLQIRSNGEIYAAFTGSLQSSPFNDRGTFLQSFNGTNWQSLPTSRVESRRTGFPALVVTATGKQFIVAHDGGMDSLIMNRRANGTSSWTMNTTSFQGMWPRAVCSGGDTIHMICLNSQYGTNRHIKYYRSTNAGLSWDINGVMLSGSDSLGGFFWNFSSDSYSIDAKGNTIAIVIGGNTNKTVLYKSTNSGSTFTTKVINSAPLPYINGKKIFSDFVTPSNYHSVCIGNNSQVHFFAGKMVIFDQDSTDDSWIFYSATDSLMYWNDNMQPNSISSIVGLGSSAIGYNYTTGIIGSLSSSYDFNYQKLSVVFDGRGANNNGFKDLYAIQSSNNGATFTNIIPLTTDGQNGIENIYPCLAKSNDNYLHIVWQKMNRQGLNTDVNVAFDTASIYYQKFTLNPVNVRFQIDASFINVSSQGIHVAGNFQGWDPAKSVLTNAGSNIYYKDTILAPGTYVEYKFVNGNTWGPDENFSGSCTVGLGIYNRFFTVPAFDTILPAFIFGNCQDIKAASKKIFNNGNIICNTDAGFFINTISNLPNMFSGNRYVIQIDTTINQTSFINAATLFDSLSISNNVNKYITKPSWLTKSFNLRVISTSPRDTSYQYIGVNTRPILKSVIKNRRTGIEQTAEKCTGDTLDFTVSLANNVSVNSMKVYLNNILQLDNTSLSNFWAWGTGAVKIVVSNNCGSDSVEYSMIENSKPNMPILNNSNSNLCEGQNTSISVSNVQTSIKYRWYDYDNNPLPDTLPTKSLNTSGYYYVQALSNLGCGSNSDTLSIRVKKTANNYLSGIVVSGSFDISTYVKDIKVINSNNIWAYTSNSVLRSSDAGLTWNNYQISSAVSITYNSMFALDSLTAWVSGFDSLYQGILFKTTNGGVTWINQYNTSFYSNNVHFFNASEGILLCDPDNNLNNTFATYYTNNGGTSWTRTTGPNSVTGEYGIQGIYSSYGNTLWFTSTKGKIYKTIDKGQNWTVYKIDSSDYVVKTVTFYNQNYGIATINNGYTSKLVRTLDGGISWNKIPYKGVILGDNSNFISFVPNKPNMLLSGGRYWNIQGVSMSVDSGLTWHLVQNTSNLSGGKISFVNSRTAFVAGNKFNNGNKMISKLTLDSISISNSGNTTFCAGDSVMLITPNSGYSYQWQKDGINLNGKTNSTLYAKNSGDYKLKVNIDNGCNAFSLNTISVSELSKPNTSVINGNANIFINSTQIYSVANTVGSSYNWFVNNGIINSGNGTNSISITWGANAGVGSVNVVEINTNGCKGDTVFLLVSIGNITLSINPTSINATSSASSNPITVTSNSSWTASSNQTWATLSSSSGTGNTVVNILLTANGSQTARTAIITFTAGSLTQTLTITQAGSVADVFSFSADTAYIPNTTNNFTENIISNRSWTLSINQAWANVSPTTGSGNGTVNITTTANNGSARTAIISATAGTISKKFVIIQDGITGINEINKINMISIYPNPTSGIVTISSSQAIENINVFDITGKLVYNQTKTDKHIYTEIDLSGLANGVYLIQTQTANGELSKSKVVVSK